MPQNYPIKRKIKFVSALDTLKKFGWCRKLKINEYVPYLTCQKQKNSKIFKNLLMK